MAIDTPHAMPSVATFLAEYGIDPTNTARGGLVSNLTQEAKEEAKGESEAGGGGEGGGGAGAAAAAAQGGGGDSQREIFLLQRKTGKHGAGLGRTTGWIHRLDLRKMGVTMLGGVSYDKVAMLAIAILTIALLTAAIRTMAIRTMAVLATTRWTTMGCTSASRATPRKASRPHRASSRLTPSWSAPARSRSRSSRSRCRRPACPPGPNPNPNPDPNPLKPDPIQT